jgi:cardiolipin synthase
LIEKQLDGVQVNLIYDGFGALHTPGEFFERLKNNGINVLEFNPINLSEAPEFWKFNQRDHRKLLIVDGKVAFLGGVNISSVYSKGSSGSSVSSGKSESSDKDAASIPWRDTHLRVEGPVVNDFQKLFLQAWQNQKGEPLVPRDYLPKLEKVGNQLVRAMGSSPEDEFSLIYVTLLSAINSAETHVYLTNAYFVPDPQFLQALKDAAARGTDVKLILPSKTDSNMMFHVSRSYYTELLTAGVEIYEEQQSLLHSKTALIDGVWSTIGSTNLDWRSFLHNHEINAVILGNQFGEQMHALFQRDLETSKRITLEEWKKRPLFARVKEKAARIWAYWL